MAMAALDQNTNEMHPFSDLRLIALLPCYPTAIDKALVGVILIGLTIMGGMLLNKAHSFDNIVVEYEDLRRLYALVFIILTALTRIVGAFT